MKTDRRGFLRIAAGASALVFGRASRASDAETALGIHRATRNTLAGAIGAGLRAYRPARRRFKPYPGKARLDLPRPDFERGRELFQVANGYAPSTGFDPVAPISQDELARLLLLTNGITGRGRAGALRAAPSAGALYSGEVYALVHRVEGLEAGVYAYAVGRHQLVQLAGGARVGEVAASLERPALAAGAAIAVLLTNVFGRYSIRYANRGYRYALIDSGHIGENLRLAAAEMGLAETAALRFEDDRLNALLGVDGREEALCSVHLVGRPGVPGADAAGPVRPLVERQALGDAGLRDGLSPPSRFHEATKLVALPPGGGAGRSASMPGAAEAAPATADSALGNPADASSPATVYATIRQRRSARRFEPAPMTRADLLRVLRLAHGHPTLRRAEGLDLYAVAHRVTDTPPGLYRYDPATSELAPRRGEDLAGALVRACLGQRKSGEAAAALVGVARLAEATARSGERAYRDLLLEAGAVAQRVYLGAEALGLAARNLAAFYDDDLDALLGLDGAREVAVHLTALGPGD